MALIRATSLLTSAFTSKGSSSDSRESISSTISSSNRLKGPASDFGSAFASIYLMKLLKSLSTCCLFVDCFRFLGWNSAAELLRIPEPLCTLLLFIKIAESWSYSQPMGCCCGACLGYSLPYFG